MIIFPFSGVDNFSFGMSVEHALGAIKGTYVRKLNRFDDSETEYVIYDVSGGGDKMPRLSLHEIEGERGVQAITLLCGPVFVEDNISFDIMTSSRRVIRKYMPGETVEIDDQTDIFVDLGISTYFEKAGLGQVPSAVIAASKQYVLKFVEN